MEKDKILKDVQYYSDWLSEPKVTGNRVIRVDIFFTIITLVSVRDLVQSQIEFLQQENIKVTVKRTGNEHTSRLGFLVGPIVDRVNMKWYEKICQQVRRINNGELELKKEVVYEGNKNEWCITLHGISSMKEKLDIAMRQMKFSKKVILNMYHFQTVYVMKGLEDFN